MGLKFSTLALAVGAAALAVTSQANALVVPNFSFDNPAVPQVSPFAIPGTGEWLQVAMPGYWPGIGQNAQTWAQNAGTFYNDQGIVDNLNGVQGAFFFDSPENKIYQDLPYSYTLDRQYSVSFLAAGGGYNMLNGRQLVAELYYVDGGNRITVASTTLTHNDPDSPTLDPITHLESYSFQTPLVANGDAWLNKTMGIAFYTPSTLGDLFGGLAGGYWDIDNVQLTEVPEPASLGILAVGAAGLLMRRRRV